MKLQNSYLQLGNHFLQKTDPRSFPAPEMLLWNQPLADALTLPDEIQHSACDYFSGQKRLPGSEPVALAYAGHQFGSYNPQLGDGRAHLLGEIALANGSRWDLQLKGSGQTRYSRSGDGLCALGPAIREYLMSEALYALGIPTTRTLAVIMTGQNVMRDQVLPGAVLTRMAASHLRIGTFQYVAANGSNDDLTRLLDYAIERHYPHLSETDSTEEKVVRFVKEVMQRQTETVVGWMRVGFIHGVMNTDNTAISGETIDFGPCAMMGSYHPHTVFSSIDSEGRYCFGNQPWIMQWNLARLAESLLPLLGEDTDRGVELLGPVISDFSVQYTEAFNAMMAAKLGLSAPEPELAQAILDTMQEHQLDYTVTFHQLTRALEHGELPPELADLETFARWQKAVTQENTEEALARMKQANPVVIPRNHQVEYVLDKCVNARSGEPAQTLLGVLGSPYEEQEETAAFQTPPEDRDRYYRTFCGT